MRTIHDLELHECLEIKTKGLLTQRKLVTRLPGGWEYTTIYKDTGTSIFVPFTSEFKPKKEKQPEQAEMFPESEVDALVVFWNTKGIVKCTKLSEGIKKAYTIAKKKHGKEIVKEAIENYSKILKSEYYFDTKWSLETFLKQGNCIPKFHNGGERWIDYTSKDVSDPSKPSQTSKRFSSK